MEVNYRIPRYLDHPKLYPVFTKGETLLVAVPLVSGWVGTKSLTGMMVGFVVGAIAFKNFKRFKDGFGEHAVKRWLYWYLPSHWLLPFTHLKAFPKSHVREYLG